MRNSKLCVGVFDSGIGGLTVLKDCQTHFPDLSFCYYGDNARAPYGNRPKEEINSFVRGAIVDMLDFGADVILLACNTATTVCMPYLRGCAILPTFGIEPPVRACMRAGMRTLILATRATCESVRMRELCQEAHESCPAGNLTVCPCESLAGEIERHVLDTQFDYTKYFPKVRADIVVLGCTHYHYIKSQIEQFYGCIAVDGREELFSQLRVHLEEKIGKGRDIQPLVTPMRCTPPLLPCQVGTMGENTSQIYFLGSGKDKNMQIYEQMFAMLGK